MSAKHGRDWLKLAAVGGGLALPFFGPELLGMAGLAGAAPEAGAGAVAGDAFLPGALASQAGSAFAPVAAATPSAFDGLSSQVLQTMGHMGPEQADILAAQNADMGVGATTKTLDSAAYAGKSVPWRYAQAAGKFLDDSSNLRLATSALSPQQQAPQNMAGPRPVQQQAVTQNPYLTDLALLEQKRKRDLNQPFSAFF